MIIDLDFENQSPLDEPNHFLVCQQKADAGDAEAQYTVAKCYHKGLSIFQNLEKAFHYYKLGADQGHFQALVLTAFCYEYGEGVKQSDQQAFHYYQLAAEQGHAGAQACLGILYAEGRGVQQSDEKALHYYQLAAEQGSVLALRYLADAYEKGLGVSPSQTKANFYLQQRLNHLKGKAATGNTIAQILLKKFPESSLNTNQSQQHALHSPLNIATNDDDLIHQRLDSIYVVANSERQICQNFDVSRSLYQKIKVYLKAEDDLLNKKTSPFTLAFRAIFKSISSVLNKYLKIDKIKLIKIKHNHLFYKGRK